VPGDKPFVLVELVGLAGSGKSSLRTAIEGHFRRLLAEDGCRGIAPDRRERPPALWLSCLAWLRLVAGQRLSLRSLSVWLDVVRTLRRLYDCRSRGGIHIIDEGLLHKFRSVRRLSPSPLTLDAAVARFADRMLIPVPSDMVVCLNVSPEVYAERLIKRDGKQVDMAKARRAVDNMQYTYADIRRGQQLDCCGDVIYVDNNETANLDDLALPIAEKIILIYRQKLLTGNSRAD
jgi:hypothetical protein